MKNTHLQHPEDTILTGDLTALDWLLADGDLSVKIDGAPAIVWGTNPANGKFFVGTKSVFNKVKIKINHSHEEIEQNHSGDVAIILHACLANLPHVDGIVQGDFIGIGGDDTYTPNTITYVFDEIIEQTIIVAPHTLYATDNEMKDCYVINDMVDMDIFEDTDTCKFVQPDTWQVYKDFDEVVGFARQVSMTCRFMDSKNSTSIQQQLNSIIRSGNIIDDITMEALAYANEVDLNTLRLWQLVASIKMDMLDLCRNNGPKAYVNGRQCRGEGYVMTNEFGMFKLVDRLQFSYANFNNTKFANA
jgi:hypothetical protein